MALGVGWHPWKLRVAECPSEFMGENHRREKAAPACPLLGRPGSDSTVKLGLDFRLLGLSQCWRVSIPDGWGLCFSGPTKATTASLGVPRLLGRGYTVFMANILFPVVLCPKYQKAWHQAPIFTAPAHPQAERMGQEPAVPNSGANSTGHQGAAGLHR